MKPFPWGLLTLILLALDLLLLALYLFRKRLARWLCKRDVASGNREDASDWLFELRSKRMIKPDEEEAWRKEFGLEDFK